MCGIYRKGTGETVMKRTIPAIGMLMFAIALCAGATFAAESADAAAPKQTVRELYTTMALTEKGQYYEITAEYPRFNAPFADKLIDDTIQGLCDGFRTQALEEAGPDTLSYGLHISFEIARFNDNILTVGFDVAQFMGGAHDFMFNDMITLDFTKQKQLALDDLFTDKAAALDAISKFVTDDLLQKVGDSEILYKEDLTSQEEHFQNFMLYPYDIEFKFASGQIVPYVLGPQESIMSLNAEELGPFVKQEFKQE
jgi:hypothetical protein